MLALDFDLAATARLLARERNALIEIRGDPGENELTATSRVHEERW